MTNNWSMYFTLIKTRLSIRCKVPELEGHFTSNEIVALSQTTREEVVTPLK